MSILTRWLLIPPVNARLIGRYRDYRRHGASAFSATLGCFWMILAWIFIPLEHPRWQRIRAEHKRQSRGSILSTKDSASSRL